jgi:peptidoglycan/LPS O-acetylase OafA/YrhL
MSSDVVNGANGANDNIDKSVIDENISIDTDNTDFSINPDDADDSEDTDDPDEELDGFDGMTKVLIGDTVPNSNPILKNERIGFLDGLRGAMCIIVIISRSLSLNEHLTNTLGQYVLNKNRAIDVFWTASGYTLALVATKEHAALTAIGRLPRLMLPVMFMGCVMSTVSIATELEPMTYLRTQKKILDIFLSEGDGGYNFVHILPLSVGFYGSVALLACHHLFSHTIHPERIGAMIAVVTLYARPDYNFFLVGYAMRHHKHWLENNPHGPVISVAAAVVCFVTLYASPLDGRACDPHGCALARYVGAASTFVCILAWKRVERVFDNPMGRFIGRYAFELYIVHYPIIKKLQNWSWLTGFHPTLLMVMAIAASLAWALLIQRHVNNAALRLSKWLAHRII